MIEISDNSDAFFIPGEAGQLLAIYTSPSKSCDLTENIVVVPAFSEEMNRARRMVSLQARRLSTIGIGTLVVDLYGTGDSQGKFEEASWDIWKSDISRAVNWVRETRGGRISLLGVRLGALLALDYARDDDINRIVFWQPVTSGAEHLREFMLVRVLEGLMQKSLGKISIEEMRALLGRGEAVEVGGYLLSPELFETIDRLDMASMASAVTFPLHWMEVSRTEGAGFKPASQEVIDDWKSTGIDVKQHAVTGHTFWIDGKVKVSHALHDETAAIFGAY